MRKLAIFVEGQTEELFVTRLVQEIAGTAQLVIETRKARGRKRFRTLKLAERSASIDQEYFVLIVDCGGDSSVKSDILEGYNGLVQSGYEAILGIRDVHPVSHSDIAKLRRGLAYGLRTKPIEVVFALAIMEIEAWFISEHSHFARISPKLTMRRINDEVGFDPSRDKVELRHHPSKDLQAIYGLAGLGYTKSRTNVERTVNALDYARLYLELGKEIPDLQCVLNCIEAFLSPDGPGNAGPTRACN